MNPYYLLVVGSLFLFYFLRYRRRYYRIKTGEVLSDIVCSNLRNHGFYLWAFHVQWRKIQPLSYFNDGQLYRIVILMRALPLRKVIYEYNRICITACSFSPHLTIKKINEFYDVNRAILIKRILREILHLFPRINRAILKHKGTMDKKKKIIRELPADRRYKLGVEISVADRSLRKLQQFYDRVNIFYLNFLKPIQDSLRRENADPKEYIDKKIGTLEKLAIIFVCIREKLYLQCFNLNITCKNSVMTYIKECDGFAIDQNDQKVVIEVKCSWNAVDMARDKANSIDMQIHIATENGFDRGIGVIIGSEKPDWIEHNGQKYLASAINTLLLYLVNNRGYVCNSQILVNDIHDSLVDSKIKVQKLLEDKRIHVISFEKLEELSYRIIKLFDKNYVSNDAIDSSIFQYCQHAFTCPKEDFVLT